MTTCTFALILLNTLAAAGDVAAAGHELSMHSTDAIQRPVQNASEPFLSPPVTPAPPSMALKATFWGGATAGGVLLAVGAVFGVLSETHAAAANERFDARILTPADRAHFDAARFDAKVANVSFGVGALSLVAAAVAYLIDPGVAGDEALVAGAGL